MVIGQSAQAMAMRNFGILYVEDNRDDVLLLQFAFEQAGITNSIYVVGDGQQAIDYLSGAAPFNDRLQCPLPGLMLLDLNLPVKMGLDVLKWVRQQPALYGLVVVVLSSSDLSSDIERAYQLGVNTFISKPAGIHERNKLAETLKHWWLHFNQYAPVYEPDMAARLAAGTSALQGMRVRKS